VGRIKKLIEAYATYMKIPWRQDVAPSQRIIFCIYDAEEELRLRRHLGEFDLATRAAKHVWHPFDLTDTFAQWMGRSRYVEKYYQNPQFLDNILNYYEEALVQKFIDEVQQIPDMANAVVSLMGVGSLFGLLKVKDVVEKCVPHVPGRLVVFFPGSFEAKSNNYRLFDSYDGWNYLAVPITAEKTF